MRLNNMNKNISYLLLTVFLAGGIHNASAVDFSDVNIDHPQATSINALHDLGVIEGYLGNTFEPDLFVNRAEALKIILTSSRSTIPNEVVRTFPDVESTIWYAKYASLAREQGIITGYPDGTFRGHTLVNYAEILKIALRAFDIRPELLYTEEKLRVNFPKYKSNEWFLPYLMYAKEKKLPILEEPAGFPTRAQMAELIYRIKIVDHFGLDGFNEKYEKEYFDLMQAQGKLSKDVKTQINTFIKNSPMLSAKSLATVVPYSFLSLEQHRDLMIEALASFQLETDLIADFWNKESALLDTDKNLLTGQLISVKNNINTTKNSIINGGKNNDPIAEENIKASLEKIRRDILSIYGKSIAARIKSLHNNKELLELLSKASHAEAYQSLIGSFDTIVQRTGDITSLIEAQDGNMDGFMLLKESVAKVSIIQTELEMIQKNIITLAKSL